MRKIAAISVLVLLFGISGAGSATIIYVDADANGASEAQAYSIDGNQVTLQADVYIDSYGWGAVGNAVWPEKELMFVTYEDSPMLVWASTKTLQKVGEFDTNISNPAGVIVKR